MTLQALGFRRLVLGLQPDAADRSAELACELASLFDLELLGLFLDNISLRRLVAMPAARAISALGAGWSSRSRTLPEFLGGCGRKRRATLRRGLPPTRAAAVRDRPRRLGASARQALANRRHRCDHAADSPGRSRRRAVCVASRDGVQRRSCRPVRAAETRALRWRHRSARARQDDPSIQTARAIASAAGERIVVVDTSLRLFGERPVDYAAEAAARVLRGLTERLMVTSRGTIRDEVALALARAAPLLSLNPAGRERRT